MAIVIQVMAIPSALSYGIIRRNKILEELKTNKL
nr:MAG TPA: hypothetical protein [Caudoviricetes sp.]